MARHPRHRRPPRRHLQPTCRSCRWRSTWPRPAQYGLKPGDVRRAAATLRRRRGGRRHLPRRQGVRRRGLERAGGPRQRRRPSENLLIDTPTGARVRLADVADVAIGPNPNAIEHEDGSRALDVGAERRGPRPRARSSADAEARAGRRSTSRAATTPRSSASTRSGRPPRTGCSVTAASRCAADPAPAAGVVRQLAAGPAGLPHPAVRAGRRGDRGLCRRRRLSLGSLVGLLHRLRDRRPQRDPADQPLPASRTRGGRDVRAGLVRAGRPRAAGADPDDVAGHRAGAGPAGRPRRPARATRSSTRWPS